MDLPVLRSPVVPLVVLLALLAGALPGAAAAADPGRPRPVLLGDFADPAVTVLGSGYVGFSTGSLVPRAVSSRPRGAWRAAGRGLVRIPSWSHADGDVWASDVARVGGWWLLYFAAPVRGIGEYGRCIGVARSRTALGGFVPVGGRPLVCPSYAKAPAAGDDVPQPDRSLPRAGVIDPSLFVEDGRPSLLYKTDRIPSSIRVVPLTRSGLRVAGDSVELMRHDGVLENPVVVQAARGLRDAAVAGRLRPLLLPDGVAPVGRAARLVGGRVGRAARPRLLRPVRSRRRGRERRAAGVAAAAVPARLDVRAPAVPDRAPTWSRSARGWVPGARCTPPSWPGRAACRPWWVGAEPAR